MENILMAKNKIAEYKNANLESIYKNVIEHKYDLSKMNCNSKCDSCIFRLVDKNTGCQSVYLPVMEMESRLPFTRNKEDLRIVDLINQLNKSAKLMEVSFASVLQNA